MVEMRVVPMPLNLEHDLLRRTTVHGMVRIRSVDRSEAVEVARMRFLNARGFPTLVKYSEHDGHLWTPTRWGHDEFDAESRIESFEKAFHRRDMLLMESIGEVPKIFSDPRGQSDLMVQELPHDLQFLANEATDRLERRLILIGGRLHELSYGPLLATNWKGGSSTPKFQVNEGRSITSVIQRGALTFGALRPENDIALIERHLGPILFERPNGTEISGEWDAEAILAPLAAERAVWHFLWEAGNLPSPWPRIVVDALVEAKRAVGARWRYLDVDLHPKDHKSAGSHLQGRDAPWPEDLLPILSRIVSISEGFFDPQSIASWRLTEERTHRFLASRPTKDAEALADFGI